MIMNVPGRRSPMTKNHYHHGNLRSELINKAIHVIEADGPGSINLRDLSTSAGVSRAAPYRHFENKAHLLTAVAARGFLLLEEVCGEVPPGKPADRLTDLCRRYLKFAVCNPGLYSVMFDPERFRQPVRDELRSASDGAFFKLEAVLLEFPGKIPGELNAGAVWAMVHGLAIILNQNLVKVIGKGRTESAAVSAGAIEGDMTRQIDHALAILTLGILSAAKE